MVSEVLEEKLQAGLAELGLNLSAHQQKQLLDYVAMIAKWNKVYNLTSIRDEGEMLTHHILDSLAVILPLQKHIEKQQKNTFDFDVNIGLQPNTGEACGALPLSKARLLDVGSGAGLPGVVIAICCPQVAVVCVDAVGKKVAFIQQAATTMLLPNLLGVHSRVESLPSAIVQQGFDVVTSRAFASMIDFVTLASNLIKLHSGVWMAMKAKTVASETLDLPQEVAVFHVEPLVVPFLNEERNLVWLHKK